MGTENGIRTNYVPYRQNIFNTDVTYNFDAMSIDFHLAWKNIFASFFDQNYAFDPTQETWITQNGIDRNNRDAP